jgi:RHS repeat-associated protein
VNGVTTRYLVDDLNPTGYAQVVEETGGVNRTYTYGLQRISENQIVNNAWTPSFYEYDGMGSVRQLTNSAGAVTDTYEYDAFGNLLNKTGTTPNEMLYRGEQWDSDLGLYYLWARWYNPVTGRFVSWDPNKGVTTDPKTLHKYLYAEGDPVNEIDPSGRQALAATAELDFWEPIKNTAAVIAVGAVAACILHDAYTLIKGEASNLGSPVASIVPKGACSVKVTRKTECTPEELQSCQKLYEYCKGARCGYCLSYCTVQCEWPFHKPECNKFNFPKDWKDFPPPPKWIY